jgi:hypothetical protein
MAQGSEHKPTDETRKLVKELSGYGLNHDNISALIGEGINRKTLCEHYRNELDIGKAIANSKIGKSIFNKAMDGDTTSMIWWSKTQMGWKETVSNEHTFNEPRKLKDFYED